MISKSEICPDKKIHKHNSKIYRNIEIVQASTDIFSHVN